MRRVLVLAVVASALAAAPTATSAPSTRAARCTNLTLDAATLRAWREQFRTTRRLGSLRLRRLRPSYYGRCGTTSYGYAAWTFARGTHPTQRQLVSLQDGPDIFKRRAGRSWHDVGDTGASVPCGPKGFPRALVRVWRLHCS